MKAWNFPDFQKTLVTYLIFIEIIMGGNDVQFSN